MTKSNNNITSSRGGSTNFLAEIADEIGEALINNPQLKSSMIKHTEKVIQKAEEYGQYLRTEWQKAKEAGLTQHDKNKDEEKWSWWTAFSKDWMWGEGVYFADNESLGVQFYIKGKPKPDPLSYLSSMVWGSVGEDYNGLELLDYQFVLLAIIHDAQNWQAGRKRIYFNPLQEKTLSDRLCRAVWHHLESKIDSYNFRDVKNTIKTALQTIKANLKQVTKNSGDDNTIIPEPNKEKTKKLHEIADALEEWGKYDEKITNTAEWNTAAAKQIIRKALTLLVNNLVLLNECKDKYGYHNPLQQCFMAIEHAASLPETKDLGDFRSWTRDFTKRHLSGGEKRSLADECIRYANKVTREIEQENKDTKSELEGMIEPKPPVFLQNALWILKYGRNHWKLILLVIFVILISGLFVLPKIELFSKDAPTNSENSRTIEFHSIPNTENLDEIKSLESMRMGISLSYVKSLFGIPIREHKLKSGRREMLYAFKPYYLQIVTDMDDLVVFFAITLRDRMFRYKIPYISGKFILGEVRYSDFGEPEETYFNVGSKTAEYREKHYYGNPGYYMDFWPAFNDSGVNLIGASNNDLGDSKICVVRGNELRSLRKKLRPNTIGIASMGYDGLDSEIHEIDVGPCRLITRELE